MSITIDNSKESARSGGWRNPGAALYDKLMESPNWKSLIAEAYLIAPVGKIKNTEADRTSFSASDVGYPHHVERDGKLVLHQSGLRAAFSRAAQQGIVSGEVEAHLKKHYREMGWYEESSISDMEQSNKDLIANIIKHANDKVENTRRDNDWVRTQLSQRFIAIHNRIVDTMNNSVADLNRRQSGRTIRLSFSDGGITAQNEISKTYLTEFEKMYNNTLNNLGASRDLDKSPSGNYRVVYTLSNGRINWRIAPTTRTGYSVADLVDSSGQLTGIQNDNIFDIADGKIRDINPISGELAHFGILGMRWGVRHRPGEGGRAPLPSSEEHRKTRIVRHTPLAALTNQQIREFNDRMNLEQQYRKLTQSKLSKGKAVITQLLLSMGKDIAKEVLKSQTEELMIKFGIKKEKKKGA